MLIIISGIAMIVAIIIALTITIVISEKFLVKHGNVKLVINDDKENALNVETGGTLLSTLTENEILIPSACGGGGTCGYCTCQVTSGGGDLLPTEEGFINRKKAKDHWRLACQVKVREDMEIKVPDEVFSTKKWECEVVSNDNVATFIKEFIVKLPDGEELDFKPGGYIQIEIPKYHLNSGKDYDVEDIYRDDWDKIKAFDLITKNSEKVIRAYSMANYPAEGDIVMLNVRIATPPWDRKKDRFKKVPSGISSSFIFSKKAGDKVTVSGPYGEFFINESESEMMYIGGGAGMAPMRSHIMHLFHTLKTKRKVTFWYGARSCREIFYEEDFRAIEKEFPNFTFNIALSEALPGDKWGGMTGFIHQAVFDHYLKDHEEPEEIEYYLCGPGVMMTAIDKMLTNLGVEKEMIRYDEF
ncbi:MAG: NADH:ubiquinone reductase (Na(+)-transporting) subunit F [Candidatus Cloacimonetes bacterium]|jgi:Na+-transporting NADH:ubiquinone oxidoreductase subunit F|nr:NADH:ubiquinone reductase (Na(+)-transporting) subunit F [Candidatus Cloacimonadota bacterium]MBT4332135.1 NADH:ubiquinone reductase (Na(+)-transporting) subunit F [Candidatus Cloacimonadota bacterium]MBT4575258.1 NADH:ubiquinone reductase (Na(+)-transporting) subunit F [Candidatus Cloacimonadota bacterium]MBT5419892.1 NADH:ubiquinone reductase (Na(+)-transporting) subunit F [Candidatus Cloacimonadota bacterium]